ncbi:hypothetical protein AAMO2058_001193900 [Amorphochlora amoebiformis]
MVVCFFDNLLSVNFRIFCVLGTFDVCLIALYVFAFIVPSLLTNSSERERE